MNSNIHDICLPNQMDISSQGARQYWPIFPPMITQTRSERPTANNAALDSNRQDNIIECPQKCLESLLNNPNVRQQAVVWSIQKSVLILGFVYDKAFKLCTRPMPLGVKAFGLCWRSFIFDTGVLIILSTGVELWMNYWLWIRTYVIDVCHTAQFSSSFAR